MAGNSSPALCQVCGASHARTDPCPELGDTSAATAQPAAPAPQALAGRPSDRHAQLTDQVIAGKYQVTRRLGAGGMGQVYLATHLAMKRVCAVKVIQPILEWDPAAVARFHREAENASRINHPNVAQVYDFGDADGVTYLAMEYVDGEALSDLLRRERSLSPRRTARIVWQTANALAAAHELGIVHRDLKPENVMLTKFRKWNDFVKVVDFGIAKVPNLEGQEVTTTSGVIGTPDYMSPEQFMSSDADPRSDIYSLAVMAVKCLSGRLPPVVGWAVMAPPKDPADPLRLRELPDVDTWPEPVLACLDRALDRDIEARFQTPEAFAEEFARLMSDWEPGQTGVREPWEGRLSLQTSVPEEAIGHTAHKESVVDRGSDPQPLVIGRSAGRRFAGLVAIPAALLAVASAVWVAVDRSRQAPGATADSIAATPPKGVIEVLKGSIGDSGKQIDGSRLPVVTVLGGRPTSPGLRLVLADSVSRLDGLTNPATMTPESAAAAVDLYRRIRTRLSTATNRVRAAFFGARALSYLERDGEACAVLRDHRAEAEADEPYAQAYLALLSACQ